MLGRAKVLTTILGVPFLPTLQKRIIVKFHPVRLQIVAVFLEDLYCLRSYLSQLITQVITKAYYSCLILVPDDVLVKKDVFLQRMEAVEKAIKE